MCFFYFPVRVEYLHYDVARPRKAVGPAAPGGVPTQRRQTAPDTAARFYYRELVPK